MVDSAGKYFFVDCGARTVDSEPVPSWRVAVPAFRICN